MKRAIERYSMPALLAGMLLLLILSTYNRLLDIGRPFPGLYILRKLDGKSESAQLAVMMYLPIAKTYVFVILAQQNSWLTKGQRGQCGPGHPAA